MSEVKRFKPVINSTPYKPYAYCEENEDGIYVRIDDYEAIKAERDALAAENGAMRELIGATGFKSETPATDAYLNSVRAGVIKQLHSEQKEWALVTWQYDSFDALKRAAVRHGDSELSGVIFMLDRIEGFAAQLRAGEPS
jgi:glutamine synthetase type III